MAPICEQVMELTGKISIQVFAPGSKSEHEAVVIDTKEGSFVLKRQEDNPFEKSSLFELEGKNVHVEGELHSYLFLAEKITEINDKG